VRDLHTQLVECIEQLYTREQELEDTHAVVATLESNLVSIKQQMTSLYYEYASSVDKWEATQTQYKQEASALNNERDDLRLKLRRLSDMSELLQREDKDSIGLQLTDLTRKVRFLFVFFLLCNRGENITCLHRSQYSLHSQIFDSRSIVTDICTHSSNFLTTHHRR